MTATDSALLALSATEMRARMQARELSPLQLLRACIARIEEINPYVNALAATCYERALTEAQAAEKALLRGQASGLLHGLPLGVKDLEASAGLLTTFGSPLFRDHVPTHDDVLVARLRRAGAIVTAKTNTPEFGAGANTRNAVWGATGNPFNPDLNAGGSSGGSAAALACDMLALCTGSDMGGSLRIPAAMCGVVGFRPSPGVVPATRRPLGWSPLSVLGPMGRTVADVCLQLAAGAGMSASDPLSYPLDARRFEPPETLDLGRLRVLCTEDFGACAVSASVRALFRRRVQAMRHLFRSCDVLTMDLGDVHRCFDVLRAQSFVAAMREIYQRDPASLGPNPRANYEMGAALLLADCAWAQAEQTRIAARFQDLFESCDLILAPTTPVTPFRWTQPFASHIDGLAQENYYRWLALTYVVTLSSHPALSLPCGLDEAGLPFGLQIVGPFRADRQTLAAGHALEQAFKGIAGLQRPRPDLARLRQTRPDPALTSIVSSAPDADDARGLPRSRALAAQ